MATATTALATVHQDGLALIACSKPAPIIAPTMEIASTVFAFADLVSLGWTAQKGLVRTIAPGMASA